MSGTRDMPVARKTVSKKNQSARRAAARQQHVERFQRRLLLLLLAVVAIIGLTVWAGGQRSQAERWLDDWLNRSQAASTVSGLRIGILVGHKDYDSGAVCENGITEGATVEKIAERVADRLRRLGADVDMLSEYDERLNGYRAGTLVSIHADSCIDRSGFKVARSDTSVIPDVEDRLVGCLSQSYGESTGLTFDWNSITPDMTQYHALKRVASQTPAAIIEVGFLGGDAGVIVRQPDLSARGIANGIICFLEGQS